MSYVAGADAPAGPRGDKCSPCAPAWLRSPNRDLLGHLWLGVGIFCCWRQPHPGASPREPESGCGERGLGPKGCGRQLTPIKLNAGSTWLGLSLGAGPPTAPMEAPAREQLGVALSSMEEGKLLCPLAPSLLWLGCWDGGGWMCLLRGCLARPGTVLASLPS